MLALLRHAENEPPLRARVGQAVVRDEQIAEQYDASE
jgi:hypothetical protein